MEYEKITLNKARKAKEKLEKQIDDLLMHFENEYSLPVASIEVVKGMYTQVKVNVKL